MVRTFLQKSALLPIAALIAIGFSACIKTEIIPEQLDPMLELPEKNLNLIVGETGQLTAIYIDELLVDRSDLVQWSAAANPAFTITENGLVTAIEAGQAWAIATAPEGLRDSVLVTVVSGSNDVASVTILNPPMMLTVGESAQLEVEIKDGSGAIVSGGSINWASSNTNAIEVNALGTATAVGAGDAQITASVDGISSLPVAIQALPQGGLSRSGQFSGNSGYSVQGTATLTQEGGSLTLEFGSDFSASNGPGLAVYLAKLPSGGLSSQNSVKLGSLQSTSGMQTYSVPGGVSLSEYDYAVIYCEPFNVRFGTAMFNN